MHLQSVDASSVCRGSGQCFEECKYMHLQSVEDRVSVLKSVSTCIFSL